jgi:hypothetical protein
MVEAGKAAALVVGAVKLDIPEGAVSADTEVTVDVSAKAGKPDADKIAIDVYDFGPDGTSFDKAVKLEFELKGVNVGKGKKAVVAWLEDGKWKPLQTTVRNGKASAETTHFTPFTVLVIADGSGQQVGGQCTADFTPCGGDLVGTWEYTGACITLPDDFFGGSDEENPFAVCDAQPVARFTIDIAGTATFGRDGSFMSEQTASVSGGVVVSGACVDQIAEEGGGDLSCEQLGGTPQGSDCVLGSEAEEPTTDLVVGTYTTDGNVVFVNEEGDLDPGGSGEEYCVRGDALTVRINDEEGLLITYTATRR